ncbi:hypothetical protein OCA13_28065 [Bacillus cereus]|uniref:hypothetical protein n=1 Tax=Bacillus sp. BH2 TaxID=2528958 RepID=UPI001417025F|nr:hypothetical protein [Bacillus sp. BH2]MCU5431292.1 hypothetical protein [Bacillus cereus]
MRLGYNHVIKPKWPAKVKMALNSRSIEPALRSIKEKILSFLPVTERKAWR